MLKAVALPAAGPSRSVVAGGVERARSQSFPYLPAIVACLGIGALTLLVLPTDLAYDPWSWLIWGRELDHLSLTTRGSASAFKPLPVFIDAILAPAGHSAPTLWVAVVRSGTALAMALAFDIGRRLQGVLAGAVAALALLTIGDVSSYLALDGMSEPLQMCCCLAALECGLSARHRAATAWLVAASMMELELTGVMVLYGLIFLVWPAQRRLRAGAILVLLVVLVGLAWILPDLIAGAIQSEAHAAAVPTAGGPLLTRVPALATIKEISTMLFWPLVVGWVAELVVGTVWFVWRRSLRPLFLPALIAALFVLGVALLTQLHRTTGTTRFLVAATSVGVVVAVCFWAEGTRTAADRLWEYASVRFGRTGTRGGAASFGGSGTRSGAARAGALAAELVVLLGVLLLIKGGLVDWRDSVRHAIHLGRRGSTAEKQLAGVITAAGGAAALLACGAVYTGPYEVPELAWALNVPSRRVSTSGLVTAPTGSVVSLLWAPVAIHQPNHYRSSPTGQRAGSAWQIFSTCTS